MKPTIGRIVHYYIDPHEDSARDGAPENNPLPAMVVAVKRSGCVDLVVFGLGGHTGYVNNVPEWSDKYTMRCWAWPPRE